MDEGAQLTGGLDGPDRAGVGLGGVLKVPEQVSSAQLVRHAVEVVIVLVPVVDDDGAVQVAVDETSKRAERPIAEEVTGKQARAGDVQVLLLRFRSRPDPDGRLVAAHDPGQQDQRADRL